jgi:hypothetical protein
MVFNVGGLQLMRWLTGSEVFPLSVRGAGTSIQSASLWGSNTLTLLMMIDAIGVGPSMWVERGRVDLRVQAVPRAERP